MSAFRKLLIVLLPLLFLVACRRDPNVAKKQYLDSGNKYFERGNFKPALIQYGNAVKIDPRYGPAYYKRGLTFLKITPPQIGPALNDFRRAVELLRDNQAYQTEYKDAMVHAAEIYLVYGRDKQSLDTVQGYCDQLLKRDPKSFDGFRLLGDIEFVHAAQASVAQQTEAEQRDLDAALVQYKKADAIKPGDNGVTMQMALVMQGKKQFPEAERLFRQVLDKDKTLAAAYTDLYQLYMYQSKAAEGEQVLKLAIQNNPKTYNFLVTLAYHYGIQGRRDDMLNVLQQIKSHAKDWDKVYRVVGDFYVRIGDGDSALREFREGILKDAKNKVDYQHAIIEVLMRQGKRAEAAEVNAQILKDNPKDADAQSLSASFMLDRGDVARAAADLETVVTRAPDNAVAHYQLGRAYLAQGKNEQARQQFLKAIEKRQDMIMPRIALAQLQVVLKEYDGALATVQDLLKLDPGNITGKLIESQALVGQKKFKDSDTLLDGMVKSNPSSPDIYYQVGWANLKQGKLKEAEVAYMKAYQLNPANVRGLLGLVETYLEQDRSDAAMQLLQGESRKAPNRLELPLLMGTTAVRSGKYQEALGYLQQVLNGLNKTSPERGEILMRMGDAYRRMGDYNNSILNLQKARELMPENETLLSLLGLVLDQAGRKPEARQAYEACLKVNPRNAMVLNNVAFLMAETDADLNLALDRAQMAKSLEPGLPEISDTLGWILLKKNLPDQAVTVFKDLVTQMPNHSTYHYHLAMGYKQRGDKAKAISELKEALRFNPPKDEQSKIQSMLSQLGG